MKKLLLVLLALPLIGFGQSWKFSSSGNDFDGKYRTASIEGTGDDYPYTSPSLVVNYFEKSNSINFYIINAGYFTSSTNTEVKLSFNNEEGIIYTPANISFSGDGSIVFFGDVFRPNNLSYLVIIQKLMDASDVEIRISNDYSQNDLRFGLSGSTKAIKFVVPFDKMFEIEQKEIEEVVEEVKIEDEARIENTESDEKVAIIEIEQESDEEFFMVVENMPEFPGGDAGVLKFIQQNMKYPPIAKEYNITGKVYVSFIVDKSGSVTDVKIVRGVDKSLDAEAVRVIKSLPKYKPGTQRGKPVRVMFTIPINFTLN